MRESQIGMHKKRQQEGDSSCSVLQHQVAEREGLKPHFLIIPLLQRETDMGGIGEEGVGYTPTGIITEHYS